MIKKKNILKEYFSDSITSTTWSASLQNFDSKFESTSWYENQKKNLKEYFSGTITLAPKTYTWSATLKNFDPRWASPSWAGTENIPQVKYELFVEDEKGQYISTTEFSPHGQRKVSTAYSNTKPNSISYLTYLWADNINNQAANINFYPGDIPGFGPTGDMKGASASYSFTDTGETDSPYATATITINHIKPFYIKFTTPVVLSNDKVIKASTKVYAPISRTPIAELKASGLTVAELRIPSEPTLQERGQYAMFENPRFDANNNAQVFSFDVLSSVFDPNINE